MTRINVIPVEELSNEHPLGENHEITRVYNLARKAQVKVLNGSKKLPLHYKMGTGHVMFFYNKLGFVSKRYVALNEEMRRRGYSPNPIPLEILEEGIDRRMFHDYNPTPAALEISRQRIKERNEK
jgi:hypothetical protein